MRLPQDFRILNLQVRDQEVDGSSPFAATILFLSQINALRCVLSCDSYFIFTDNADKICGFAWKVGVLSRLKTQLPGHQRSKLRSAA